jgi:hypothetical protein
VLAVSRQDAHVVLLRQRQHKWTTCNQRLLVGQADVLACLDCGDSWQQAGAANDASDDGLNVWVARNLRQQRGNDSSSNEASSFLLPYSCSMIYAWSNPGAACDYSIA